MTPPPLMPLRSLLNHCESSLQMQTSKGIGGITTCLQLPSTGYFRTDNKSSDNVGVMATNTYGDLCLCSRCVGMVMRNLSAWEVQIPPKTVMGNLQMAEIVPNLKVFKQMSAVLPPKEQAEPLKVGQPYSSNSPEKELTCAIPTSLQLGPDVQTPGHDVLEKVNLLGCIE